MRKRRELREPGFAPMLRASTKKLVGFVQRFAGTRVSLLAGCCYSHHMLLPNQPNCGCLATRRAAGAACLFAIFLR